VKIEAIFKGGRAAARALALAMSTRDDPASRLTRPQNHTPSWRRRI